MASLSVGTIAFAVFGLVGGKALASFAISGINPFYFEQRWRSLTTLASTPAPAEDWMRSDGSYAMPTQPDLLYGVRAPAAVPIEAAYKWQPDAAEAAELAEITRLATYEAPRPFRAPRVREDLPMVGPAVVPAEPEVAEVTEAAEPTEAPKPAEAPAPVAEAETTPVS